MRTFVFALVLLLTLGTFDVEAVQSVSWSEFSFDNWLASFDIINSHAISDELWDIRRHYSEARQLVNRVQRIRRLSFSNELEDLSLSACNIRVCQVVLWLVKAYMKHAWA